jgi:hypothetical protein
MSGEYQFSFWVAQCLSKLRVGVPISSPRHTRPRAAGFPVRAVEVPRVLHEAIVPGHHACVKTVHVPRRAQSLAIVPVRVAGRQHAAERLVAAIGADDQVGAAVDAVDVGSGGGVKVGRCHEQQGQGQEGGQE